MTQNNKYTSLFVFIGISLLITTGVGIYYFNLQSRKPINLGSGVLREPSPTSSAALPENNILISYKGKMQFIELDTGKRKDFVDGEFISAGYLYHYNGIFSPDKKTILFKKDTNLWSASYDGTDLKQLTTQGRPRTDRYWNIEIGNIKWSPDGSKIFYSVYVDNTGNGATSPHDTPSGTKEGLWVMNADGTNQKYISRVKAGLEWMPDSHRIVFIDGEDYVSPTKTYDLDTNKIDVLLPNMSINKMMWSTSGDYGFYSDKQYGNTYLVDNKMKILDILTRQSETETKDGSAYVFREASSISPDGKNILFTEMVRPKQGVTGEYDANVGVYLWNTMTTQETKLPVQVSIHTKPFWSRDSKKIVYVKQGVSDLGYISLVGDLFYYNIETGQKTQLTRSNDIEPLSVEY